MIEFNVEKTYGEDRSRTVNDYYIEPGYLAPDLSMISYTLSFQNLVIAFILFIFAEVFERRRLVLAFSHFRNNCQWMGDDLEKLRRLVDEKSICLYIYCCVFW